MSSKKQDQVLAYINSNATPWLEQPKIIRHFKDEFKYRTMKSARVCVGLLLMKLSKRRLITSKKVRNDSAGSVPKNIWRTI